MNIYCWNSNLTVVGINLSLVSPSALSASADSGVRTFAGLPKNLAGTKKTENEAATPCNRMKCGPVVSS
jgi:hypothetical protein